MTTSKLTGYALSTVQRFGGVGCPGIDELGKAAMDMMLRMVLAGSRAFGRQAQHSAH